MIPFIIEKDGERVVDPYKAQAIVGEIQSQYGTWRLANANEDGEYVGGMMVADSEGDGLYFLEPVGMFNPEQVLNSILAASGMGDGLEAEPGVTILPELP